jgi:predicted TIM-barrel fold metal-dependent hydrolase
MGVQSWELERGEKKAYCAEDRKEETVYCTEADFSTMAKVDIHCHINVARHAFMEQALADNFRIVTINTDSPTAMLSIEEQERIAILQRKAFPGRLACLATFSMDGWDDDGWRKKTIEHLDRSFANGAIGVKVWKNIGMAKKDKAGKFVMIDDPRFDPVFDYLATKGMPVCGHLGEPKNCWLPMAQMTVSSDKHYFKAHPQYYMYLHPDFPSYEDQIRARDNMLRKHPNLRFMGAHLGSLEWSVDELAKRLDMFPNMTVDTAARMGHLEVQAKKDRTKVRDFLIKYQGRIIYGTDGGDWPGGIAKAAAVKETSHKVWVRDWKFLTTDETMTAAEVAGEFRGLKLPREVVEKVYYKNALNAFPGLGR